MRISLTSVLVEDQNRALAFYIGVLGFVKKMDIPMGEFRWLTVVSPDAPDGVELVLEPNAHPAAKVFQQALFGGGIPATSFESSDIHAEYERLRGRGVVFRGPPAQAGPVTIATSPTPAATSSSCTSPPDARGHP